MLDRISYTREVVINTQSIFVFLHIHECFSVSPLQDIVLRLHTNPRRIFGLPEQPDTYIEVEVGSEWNIPDAMKYTKSRWTPFAGRTVYGSVKRVFLRGQIAMVDGKVSQVVVTNVK